MIGVKWIIVTVLSYGKTCGSLLPDGGPVVPERVAIAITKEAILTPIYVSFDGINNSNFGRFTPRKEPRYPQYRRLGGLHGSLDGFVEYNIRCPLSVF